MVAEILRLMGQPFNKRILEDLIDEVDADSKYQKSPHYSFNLRPNNFFFKKIGWPTKIIVYFRICNFDFVVWMLQNDWNLAKWDEIENAAVVEISLQV